MFLSLVIMCESFRLRSVERVRSLVPPEPAGAIIRSESIIPACESPNHHEHIESGSYKANFESRL